MTDPELFELLESRLLDALDAYFRAPEEGAHELRALDRASEVLEDLKAAAMVHAVEGHGLTHGHLARGLEVSRQAVHQRLTRARQRLANVEPEKPKPWVWAGLTPTGDVAIRGGS